MSQALLALLLVTAPVSPLTAQDEKRAEAQKLTLPALEPLEMKSWREFLRPGKDELKHESIGWLADFASGMRASAKEQKPLLFWAMNGHPLGCT